MNAAEIPAAHAHGASADRLVADAQAASAQEHAMGLRQGLRLYPKAVAWSMLISTCIAMEGYDLCLLGNFCACSRARGERGH
jgi:SP family general alpha glucoside:H+ symporter-like MFS transporter